MTPAPITPRRFGTASNSSAPHESTICLPSNGRLFSSIGAEPAASTMCLRGQLFFLAVLAGELDAVAAEQLAVALQAGDARAP